MGRPCLGYPELTSSDCEKSFARLGNILDQMYQILKTRLGAAKRTPKAGTKDSRDIQRQVAVTKTKPTLS